MLNTLFGNSNVPLLEQVVNFTEARHGVLAGNIANLDTPGYTTRDLSPELFQKKLREAVEASRVTNTPNYGFGQVSNGLGQMSGIGQLDGYGQYPNAVVSQSLDSVSNVDRNFQAFDNVKDSYNSILRHDGVNVSMENQINEMVKNQQEHNLAVGILSNQFRLLRVAISERAA